LLCNAFSVEKRELEAGDCVAKALRSADFASRLNGGHALRWRGAAKRVAAKWIAVKLIMEVYRMVLGSHVIFGAYGFWLPNDPRGSWSEFVGSWELFRYGRATKTQATRSVAKQPHNQAVRLAGKAALKRPAVKFTGRQALAIGQGLARYVERSGLKIWACAILPDHIHLVLARHRLNVEQLAVQMKGEATACLLAQGIHPMDDSMGDQARRLKCFARGQWKVFLDTENDIRRAIRYVEANPPKEGKRPQHWEFVTPYV
jgi:REP element-mobilizing transposase RayT